MFKEQKGEKAKDDVMENTNKVIEQAKQLALNGFPDSCKDIAKKFFDCIHEELRPFNEDGRIYSQKELQQILESEVIPKCKELYNIDKCLNQNKNDNMNDEEDDDEDDGEIKL